MTVGFILIKVNTGAELEAYNKLIKVDNVVEVYQIFGKYDIIAKILADSFQGIAEIVVHKIRTIEEVIDTETITGMNIFEK